MAEAEGSPATKCRKRSYVALAENLDESAEDNNLVVVGNCVSTNAIRRSGLLSGIDSTEGLASLPSELTPEDVKLWETSYLVDIELPLDELVTVLKVADALGDRNDAAWVKKLADLMFTAEWADAEQSNAMLSALLRLRPHLLQRVLSVYISTHSLSDALLRLPSPLHSVSVAAAAAQCPFSIDHHTAATVLTFLPTTEIPAPGLQQLDLKAVPHDGSLTHSPSATGALLARAAAAHPSLTSLCLGTFPLPPQWLRSFSECLAPGALPALISLTVFADAHPGGCAEVAACLTRLPALTTLNLTLNHAHGAAPASETLSSYTRLAAAAAALPALQHLTLCEGWAHPSLPPRGTRTRFTDRPSCAHSFLSILRSSDLQYLELKLMTARAPLPAIVSQILCCTAIEELHISAAVRISDIEQANLGSTAFELPALRDLTVKSNCLASSPTIAGAIAELATTSMTSLVLSRPEIACQTSRYRDVCSETRSAECWRDFFRVLRRCTCLRVLRCGHVCKFPEAERADASRDFAAALVQLTELNELRLQGHCVGLEGAVLGGAIATLTSLRTLGFECHVSGTMFDQLQPIVDACCELGRVTDLDLCMHGVTPAQVTEVLTCMHELSHLQLWEAIFPEPAEAAVEALQSHFSRVFIEAH